MGYVMEAWRSWLAPSVILAGAVLLALAAHYVIFSIGQRIAARTASPFDDSLVRHSRQPAKWILPLLALLAALPEAGLRPEFWKPIGHAAGVGLIAAAAWLVVALMDVVQDVLSAKYSLDKADNLKARRIQTQAQVIRRIVTIVVAVVAASMILMTFPEVRQIGTSLLASAGLAGLIAGLAARPALSNLIAGLQIALSEPIRIDDVVIVEGEWGWIEEIGTTYVVVRIWDLRRLVVPLSYFIEKPFQNWTRQTANLLGTVFVSADYTVPVEEVRRELKRILDASPLWDRKAWALEVTNATEHTLELRALMSAEDSSKAWDLRCAVREKLVAFLQERCPQSLPKTRAELGGGRTASAEIQGFRGGPSASPA